MSAVRLFSAAIEAFGVTVSIVPPFLRQVLAAGETVSRQRQSLQEVPAGGAAVYPGLLSNFRKFLPKARLIPVHGSTESGHATLGDLTGQTAISAGKPLPDVGLDIMTPDARWRHR